MSCFFLFKIIIFYVYIVLYSYNSGLKFVFYDFKDNVEIIGFDYWIRFGVKFVR